MKLSTLISKNKVIFILPILSGILLCLAFPPSNLGFLVWVTLIPFLFFLNNKDISPKKAFIGGSLTGIIFFGKLFEWLFATYPFDWLGISTSKGNILVLIIFIVLWLINICLGFFLGVFAWLSKKMINLWNSGFYYLLVIPSLWVLFEYLRAWGFNILWIGKENLWGSHWTFGNLAYTLHNNLPLIQLADIAGIYGISFLIVFLNSILFLFIKIFKEQRQRKNFLVIFLLILMLIFTISGWVGYGIFKLKTEEKGDRREIALLQTNFLSGSEFNPYQREGVFKAILNLFHSPAINQQNPDFIIAPEGFGIVSLVGDKQLARYLLGDFWHPGQIYLENQKIIDENEKPKSRLFYYDLEKEKPLGYYDKKLLVPNGDFLPYITKLFLNIYSFNVKLKQRLYQPGEKVEPAQTPKGIIGGTICSSILSPQINRQMTKKGAEFLVVVSSDAPFHGSKSLLAQNLAMSKLRAIENRRYFAQATNMGYSFLLDSKGKIITKSSDFGNKILSSDIKLIDKKTIYTKFGDWVLVFAFLILLILIFKKAMSKKVIHKP